MTEAPMTNDAPPAVPLIKHIERILDEKSAWIAMPSAEVTREIAIAAGICAFAALDERIDFATKEMEQRALAAEARLAEAKEKNSQHIRDHHATLMLRLAAEHALEKRDAEVARLTKERDDLCAKMTVLCSHNCEHDGCALPDVYEKEAAHWADKYHEYKALAEEAVGVIQRLDAVRAAELLARVRAVNSSQPEKDAANAS